MLENINIINKRDPSTPPPGDQDLTNGMLKLLQDNKSILIGGGAAILIIALFYIYARIKYRRGRNIIIFSIALIIADKALDIAFFVNNVLKPPGKFLMIPSLTVLLLSAVFSLTLAFSIMVQQSIHGNNPAFEKWLRRNKRFAGTMTVFSMMNIEMVRLLNSKLLGLEIFNAKFDRNAQKKIFIGALIIVFIEDIPQLVMVVIYKQNIGQLQIVPFLSLITSVIIILNNVISRIYELISIPRPSKSVENPDNEREAEDYVLSFFNRVKDDPSTSKTADNISNNNNNNDFNNTSGNSNLNHLNSNNNSKVTLESYNNNNQIYYSNSNSNSNYDLNNNINQPPILTTTPPITFAPSNTILTDASGMPIYPTTTTTPTSPVIQSPQQIGISPEGLPYATAYIFVPNENQGTMQTVNNPPPTINGYTYY